MTQPPDTRPTTGLPLRPKVKDEPLPGPREALTTLGLTRVEDFQLAFALGPTLAADGRWGKDTAKAALVCLRRHAAGLPDISPRLSCADFACGCGGYYRACHRVRVIRPLLSSLERLQANLGRITIRSGYRCAGYNERVGGARDSQHRYGAAADLEPEFDAEAVKALGIFAGIGSVGGMALHLDRRDMSPSNPSGGTLHDPTRWTY